MHVWKCLSVFMHGCMDGWPITSWGNKPPDLTTCQATFCVATAFWSLFHIASVARQWIQHRQTWYWGWLWLIVYRLGSSTLDMWNVSSHPPFIVCWVAGTCACWIYASAHKRNRFIVFHLLNVHFSFLSTRQCPSWCIIWQLFFGVNL